MDTTAVSLKKDDRLHFDKGAYTFTIRTDTILGSNFTSYISTLLSLVYRQHTVIRMNSSGMAWRMLPVNIWQYSGKYLILSEKMPLSTITVPQMRIISPMIVSVLKKCEYSSSYKIQPLHHQFLSALIWQVILPDILPFLPIFFPFIVSLHVCVSSHV